MNRKRIVAGLALATAPLVALQAGPAFADTVTLDKSITVTGQGSSFISNMVEQCKADVKSELGINISYQPTGSGAGRSAYIAGTNDFAGSDVAFTAAELPNANKKPFVYIPAAAGGIAIVYRLKGVEDLRFSAPTLAKIFKGEIFKWNDAAIAKDNPKALLPDSIIKVVVRSDSSGTSSVFSDFLDVAGKGAWGKGTTSNFPVPANGIAQKGSDGVSNYVAGDQGEGAITYAETSFATERKLSVAKVINAGGNAVSPDPANVGAGIAAAAINDDGTLLLNFAATAANAYPISTTAYLIAPQTMDKAKGDVLRTFLTYMVTNCQAKATKVGYSPLPERIVKLNLAAIAKINPGSGDVPVVGAAAPATTAPATTAAPVTTAATATTKAAATTKKVVKKTTKKVVKKK